MPRLFIILLFIINAASYDCPPTGFKCSVCYNGEGFIWKRYLAPNITMNSAQTEIVVGQSVCWSWTGFHNMVFKGTPSGVNIAPFHQSGSSSPGTYEVVINNVSQNTNDYVFECTFHSGMEAKFTAVPAPATPAPTPAPTSPCVAGQYYGTEEGTSNKVCTTCPGGKFSENSALECTVCPIGKYQNTTPTTCLPCPTGKFGPGPGVTLCPECVKGTFNDIEASSSCKPCNIPGKYADEKGQIVCKGEPCLPGKFYGKVGDYYANAYTCKDCPLGKFQVNASATGCDNCASGKFNGVAGVSSAQLCIDCIEGKFSLEGATVCSSCPAGKFQDNPGSGSCKLCENGKFSTLEQRTTICDVCGKGKFQALSGQANCLDCELGKTTSFTGARSASNCTEVKTCIVENVVPCNFSVTPCGVCTQCFQDGNSAASCKNASKKPCTGLIYRFGAGYVCDALENLAPTSGICIEIKKQNLRTSNGTAGSGEAYYNKGMSCTAAAATTTAVPTTTAAPTTTTAALTTTTAAAETTTTESPEGSEAISTGEAIGIAGGGIAAVAGYALFAGGFAAGGAGTVGAGAGTVGAAGGLSGLGGARFNRPDGAMRV